MVENVFNSITGEKGYKSQLRTRVMRYSKSFVPESRVSIIQFKMNYRNIFLCNILSQHLENLIILLSERGIILGTSIILVLFMWYTYNLLLLFLFYGLIIKLLWVNSLVLNPDFEKTPVGWAVGKAGLEWIRDRIRVKICPHLILLHFDGVINLTPFDAN